MANVRPKKTKVRVDSVFDDPPGTPPEEIPRWTFDSAYDNMHSSAFDGPSSKGDGTSGIKSPKVGSLESMVSTLAKLHFTTKGKINEDGKFELVFCSPEPVTSVEIPKIEPQPVVRFEEPRARHERRRRPKTRFLL